MKSDDSANQNGFGMYSNSRNIMYINFSQLKKKRTVYVIDFKFLIFKIIMKVENNQKKIEMKQSTVCKK
jgi:hypothetical protein